MSFLEPTVLKALTDSFIGAGMDAFHMSSFNTSSGELVGESSIFDARVFEGFHSWNV